MATNLKPYDRFGDGDEYTEVERVFDPAAKSVTEVFTLVAGGERRQYVLRSALYDPGELQDLLEGAGFVDFSFYGGYDVSPLHDGSPMILVVAR